MTTHIKFCKCFLVSFLTLVRLLLMSTNVSAVLFLFPKWHRICHVRKQRKKGATIVSKSSRHIFCYWPSCKNLSSPTWPFLLYLWSWQILFHFSYFTLTIFWPPNCPVTSIGFCLFHFLIHFTISSPVVVPITCNRHCSSVTISHFWLFL